MSSILCLPCSTIKMLSVALTLIAPPCGVWIIPHRAQRMEHSKKSKDALLRHSLNFSFAMNDSLDYMMDDAEAHGLRAESSMAANNDDDDDELTRLRRENAQLKQPCT